MAAIELSTPLRAPDWQNTPPLSNDSLTLLKDLGVTLQYPDTSAWKERYDVLQQRVSQLELEAKNPVEIELIKKVFKIILVTSITAILIPGILLSHPYLFGIMFLGGAIYLANTTSPEERLRRAKREVEDFNERAERHLDDLENDLRTKKRLCFSALTKLRTISLFTICDPDSRCNKAAGELYKVLYYFGIDQNSDSAS